MSDTDAITGSPVRRGSQSNRAPPDTAQQEPSFELHLQPIVDLSDNQARSAESLLRLRDPVRGLVHPDEFLPAASMVDARVGIDSLVVEQSCDVVMMLRQRAYDTRLSLNMFTSTLMEAGFADHVLGICEQKGVDPSAFSIEVLETCDARRVTPSMFRNLDILRDSGMHLQLDDVVMSPTAHVNIGHFKPDGIKLDKSLISGDRFNGDHETIADSPSKWANAFSLMRAARNHDLEVTAEGVETEDQLDIVRRLGCNRAQGFLFSPAMRPDRFCDFVAGKDVDEPTPFSP